MSQLFYARDIQGYPSTGTSFSQNKYKALLEQDAPLSLIIPGSSQEWLMQVVVEPNAMVWSSVNVIPNAALTASMLEASNCDLINSYTIYQRKVKANDEVYFVTSDAESVVSIVLYSLN